MKTEIPEALKKDLPQTTWGKILTATPVVMTVLATMLAGLSSSEMTRAQYARSTAAQQQSKAGDQWSFFQAKRLRGAIQRNTCDLLQAGGELRPLDAAALQASIDRLGARLADLDLQARATIDRGETTPAAKEALGRFLETAGRRQDDARRLKAEWAQATKSPAVEQALQILQRGELPAAGTATEPPPPIRAAMEAIEASAPDPEVRALLAEFDGEAVESALAAGRQRVRALDAATTPVNQGIDTLEALINRRTALLNEWPPVVAAAAAGLAEDRSLGRDFTGARLRYAALRYEAEARLNQAIANLYEIQVRRSNIAAERHHARSQRFFFGMLAAQAAVIIATFAIAARQRNLLWSLAAAAGIAAVALAIYVYVFV